VTERSGREEPPIASGFGLADSAAHNLLCPPDRIEEQLFLRASGCALYHAAETEEMHVNCYSGRGTSLSELFLAEHVVLEVGTQTVVCFRDDEGGVPGLLHAVDVFGGKGIRAVVLGGAGREVRG